MNHNPPYPSLCYRTILTGPARIVAVGRHLVGSSKAALAASLPRLLGSGLERAGRRLASLGGDLALLVSIHAGEAAAVARVAALGRDLLNLFLRATAASVAKFWRNVTVEEGKCKAYRLAKLPGLVFSVPEDRVPDDGFSASMPPPWLA